VSVNTRDSGNKIIFQIKKTVISYEACVLKEKGGENISHKILPKA